MSFLCTTVGNAGQSDWLSTDSHKEWKRNCKRQPKDWIYRTKQIAYTFNAQGYRSPKWASIDWANSTVFFGCSNVFGVGLDDYDTLPYQYQTLTGNPAVNLGVPGSSNYLNYKNFLYMLETYPKPRAIVNTWTDYSRLTIFGKKTINLGSWQITPLYKAWNQYKNHSETWAKIIQDSWRMICKFYNIPFIEASYFDQSARMFDCHLFEMVDKARDLQHPGIESQRHAALWSAEQLSSIST
jgi:hypothetical protein